MVCHHTFYVRYCKPFGNELTAIGKRSPEYVPESPRDALDNAGLNGANPGFEPDSRKGVYAVLRRPEDELIEAAVQHAGAVHGEKDTPEFRAELRKVVHEGMPLA